MSVLRTIELSIKKSSERISELEKELYLIRMIDIDQLIANYQGELEMEKERLLYLKGLRAQEFSG